MSRGRKLDKPAFAFAAAFFLVTLVVLYAGADHPPPVGFLWVVFLDLVAAGLVYLRVPTYAAWQASRRPGRVLRVLRDGAFVGLLFGLITAAFAWATRSTWALPEWESVLIWCAAVTLVGVLCAALLYACIAMVSGQGGRSA